jgi:hypothetical protein
MGQTSRTAGDGAVVDLVMQRVVGATRRRGGAIPSRTADKVLDCWWWS